MADAVAAAAGFGPHQKMTLDADLVQVLTAGDAVRLEELLMGREGCGGDDGGYRRTDVALQVSINVGAAALRAAAPRTGTSSLLGVTSNGNTALHLVASRGHVELAKLISEMAPSLVATRNKCLDTPLHCAAKAGHRDVAACLLPMMRAAEGTAPLRAMNQLGATALHEAVRHGRAEVVDLFMAEAPELAAVTSGDGVSPLYLAATTGSVRMVAALLRPSRDGTPSPASFAGREGRTALHVAAAISKGMWPFL
uniref:Uncharacterized protein n=1 Tax=Oryza glaberrima TaxID=4538 RepID=I1QE55_ORYGL